MDRAMLPRRTAGLKLIDLPEARDWLDRADKAMADGGHRTEAITDMAFAVKAIQRSMRKVYRDTWPEAPESEVWAITA